MAGLTWLHSWLDAHELSNSADVDRAIKDRRLWLDLVDRVEMDLGTAPSVELGTHGIMAGRTLDLTSFMVCSHPACMERQVDDLFSSVWHYFDKIAVVGPDSHEILENLHLGRANAKSVGQVKVMA